MVRFVGLTMGMLVPGMRRACLDGDESTIAGKSHRSTPAMRVESGRRESNPRSQLGKLMFCL